MILSILFAIQAILFVGQIAIVIWIRKYVRDSQHITVSLASREVNKRQRTSKAWS